MTDETTEYTFYAGELIPTSELAAMHRVTPAEDDEVEFVSPSVPGRMMRMYHPAEESG